MNYLADVKQPPDGGFTRVDLIVVIVILAVMAALILPVFRAAKAQGVSIQCINNVKSIAISTVSYAIDNGDRLPDAPKGSSHWAWDISWDFSNQLTNSDPEFSRNTLYDPGFSKQNDDRFWNASSNSYRIIGYALALAGEGSTVIASNQNRNFYPSMSDRSIPANAFVPDPAQRVLVADAIISFSGQNDPTLAATYQWKNIPGVVPKGTRLTTGRWNGFSTPHTDNPGKVPFVGNVGMMDGHAQRRAFSNMLPRTTGAGNTPVFWW